METREVKSAFLRDGILALVLVVIAFLALDDITTDTAESFALEWTALAGCTLGLIVIAWRAWRRYRLTPAS
jgi:hypothetical protein